jgi:chromosome segregation protein
VETVLGPYLQAISVDSLDAIAAGLGELTGGGLALLESGSDRRQQAAAADLLMAHVRGPAAVAPLLEGVRVTESLPSAIAIRTQLANGESIITQDGFWVGRHWVRINRSDDPQVGVLARGEEIKQLRDSVRSGAQRIEEVAKALSDTRAQLEHLEEARVNAQAEANRRQQLYSEAKTDLGT